MIKSKLFFCAVLCLLASGCKKEVDQEELVRHAAKQYYDYLLQGDYGAWVDGFYRTDSISEGYRSQLINNAKMFIACQQTVHEGIKSAEVKGAELDTARHVANVFLTLTYGDKGKEQVLMPMIHKDGLWYMR